MSLRSHNSAEEIVQSARKDTGETISALEKRTYDPPTVQKLEITPSVAADRVDEYENMTMVRGSLAGEKNEDQERTVGELSKAETKSLRKEESHIINPLQEEMIYAVEASDFL